MVHQQKIRVAYLPPEGESIPEDAAEQPSLMTSDGDLSVWRRCNIFPPYIAQSLHVLLEIRYGPRATITY
jgi:hypothetical protein